MGTFTPRRHLYKPVPGVEVHWGALVNQNWDRIDAIPDPPSPLTVSNGSFEIDSNADGIPDGWERHLYPGGIGAFEDGSPAHGARAYRFTHPGGVGNGGGLLLSDFIEVDHLVRKVLHFILWSSVPGIQNIVQILFFNAARVHLTTINVYSSTANPTFPTYFVRVFSLPMNARFIRIRLIGGNTDVNVAGTTWFDGVSLGSMPYWGVRRDFEVPESHTFSGGWVDVSTGHLSLEFNSNVAIIDLRFWANVRLASVGLASNACQRFRIGNIFSNVGCNNTLTPVSHEYRFPPFIPSDFTMSSLLPITQQLMSGDGVHAAIGGKTLETVSLEYTF